MPWCLQRGKKNQKKNKNIDDVEKKEGRRARRWKKVNMLAESLEDRENVYREKDRNKIKTEQQAQNQRDEHVVDYINWEKHS